MRGGGRLLGDGLVGACMYEFSIGIERSGSVTMNGLDVPFRLRIGNRLTSPIQLVNTIKTFYSIRPWLARFLQASFPFRSVTILVNPHARFSIFPWDRLLPHTIPTC